MLRRMRWLGRGRVRVVGKKLLAILAERLVCPNRMASRRTTYIRKANNRMQRSICNYESEGSRVLRG
jgi:hypothetical protein